MSPVTVDRALAAVLLLAELEVWLTGDAGGHRLLAAVVAPVLTACLALRREYPLLAGIVGHTAAASQFAITPNIQVIATSVAWFCALYGLTVWTTPRRFAFGVTYVALVNLVPWTGRTRSRTASSPSASSRSS
jgi:hypothetical protein